MSVIEEIAAERERQKSAEGWTEQHDDDHCDGELAVAAACYAACWKLPKRTVHVRGTTRSPDSEVKVPRLWPWTHDWWNPKTRRRNLVRAAALIVAEIERIDRASLRAGEREGA